MRVAAVVLSGPCVQVPGLAGGTVMRMAGRAAAVAAVAMVVLSVPIQATASSYRCFHVYAPYQSYATSGGCRSGYVRAALPAGTVQLVTVTNWRQTRTYALVNAFSFVGGSWPVVGPVDRPDRRGRLR